ncbi:MAG: hypothetical protein A2Y10_06000 [Planctomycetes bacterium GWF2_41_51]|nr:MAG: hypothetical protein A2Y10_06000 [Planctomycetes bacterium GWF2_41_51]
MVKIQECREAVGKTLAPYGLFLQRGTLPDSDTQGFPVEPGIWAITGVVMGIFLQAFFKAFGKECGKNAGKAICNWLSSKDNPESMVKQIEEISQLETKEILDTINNIAVTVEQNRYEQFVIEVQKSMTAKMCDLGLPTNRAEIVSTKMVKIIEHRLIDSDKEE